jgi:4-diphosphocytidyl-2-C-methyl-D-erythritol kinase
MVSAKELQEMALRLGADVPFFLWGSDAWVEGVGEVITPIEMPDRWFLLVNPRVHVGTQEIFQSKELTRSHEVRTIAGFLDEAVREEEWVNELEPVVCSRFEEVRALQRWFRGYGAAKMSGSGSTFFLECRSESEARSIAKEVPPKWWHCVTKSMGKS